MNEEFNLTEEHIKLLNNSYVSWFDGYCDYGVACIDGKRPYGNSDVVGDIHEILTGETIDEDKLEEQGINYDEFCENLYTKYKKIHSETETALQIVLSTKAFEVGQYRKDGYGKNWTKVSEL